MDKRLFRLIAISALMLMARAAAAQTPTASFADVEQLLLPGDRIIVRAEDGRTTHGRVVAAASNRLEIRRRRWNFRQEHKIFEESAVRQIELEDSDLNGMLIGAGVGALSMVLIDHSGCDMTCLAPFALSVPVGVLIGEIIDRAIHPTIYLSSRGRGLTFSPMLNRTQLGLMARLQF